MNDAVQFLQQIGFVAKIVLLVLLFLSVVSWGVIFEKSRQFRRINHESKRFLRFFRINQNSADVMHQAADFKMSPYARIYKKVASHRQQNNGEINSNDLAHGLLVKEAILMKTESAVSQVMINAAVSSEISELDKNLIFLSTTVSVSPFLGLMGTIWGIMSAFMSMGMKGSADIGTVGPGIAEALITTIAGLAVAIPALIAYNFFVDRIRRINQELEIFTAELLQTLNKDRVL
ncbi:MAG: MotA/TolQ/ExbB proton channel family protein [Calditrichaceae bacterium]